MGGLEGSRFVVPPSEHVLGMTIKLLMNYNKVDVILLYLNSTNVIQDIFFKQEQCRITNYKI